MEGQHPTTPVLLEGGQASELTPTTIFQFKMCCTGHALGDLQPARYPDQSTELTQTPGVTAKKHRKKRPSQKAPGTLTPALDMQTVTAKAPVTMAGHLPHDVMFQFDLTADNTKGANMANGATLFNINMGLNAPLSTPSGLFLPDDMHLGGPSEDGMDQGLNVGALETQTFSPGPMMSNFYRGLSDLGGLLDGVLDSPGTPWPSIRLDNHNIPPLCSITHGIAEADNVPWHMGAADSMDSL